MRTIWAMTLVMVKELVRKKDLYVLFIFMMILLGLLASQTFFHVEGISRYIKDFGYSLVMLFSFIISVTFSAKQLPAEIESRTIYPLLAKPVSRYMVVVGKCCGGLAVSAAAFTVFFAGFSFFYVTEGIQGSAWLLVQGYVLGLLFLCMVSALAVFFSTILTLSANVTLTFLLYMMIGGFSDTLRNAALFTKGAMSYVYGALYYLMPHFDFYDLRVRLTHSWDPLPGWVVRAITIYTIVYCIILLYFAGSIFRRRRL